MEWIDLLSMDIEILMHKINCSTSKIVQYTVFDCWKWSLFLLWFGSGNIAIALIPLVWFDKRESCSYWNTLSFLFGTRIKMNETKETFHSGGRLAIISIFLLIFILIIPTTNSQPRAVFDSKISRQQKTETSYCITHECNRTAEDLMKNINLSLDPCDDFYEFVCGKWSDNQPT